VRLAFSVMIQSDSDVLLIDEVLAVGDAAFQRKCMGVFDEMRDSPRTVVLVTHDMSVVQSHCHRAMVIEDGELVHLGAPETAGREYLRLNYERVMDEDRSLDVDFPDIHMHLVHASIDDEAGEPVTELQPGEPIRLSAELEALRELRDPHVVVFCANTDGVSVFELDRRLAGEGNGLDRLAAGSGIRLAGTIDNPLQPGSYSLTCVVRRSREEGGRAAQAIKLADFDVLGSSATTDPVISVGANLDVTPQGAVRR
jgi:hypothetical protein